MAYFKQIQAPDGTQRSVEDKSLNELLEELLDGSKEDDANAGA